MSIDIDFDILTNIINGLNNNDIIEISKKRKRQDSINKVSQKSRLKKNKRYNNYETHIKELHTLINSDSSHVKKITKLKECIDNFTKNNKL